MYVEFVIFLSRLYFTLFFSHIKANFFSKKSNHDSKIKNFVVHQQLRTEHYETISRIVEKLSSTEIKTDSGSLKFFKTMLKIWDYANVSFKEYQKLSFDVRSAIPRNYYSEISIYIEVEIYFLYFFLCGFFSFLSG